MPWHAQDKVTAVMTALASVTTTGNGLEGLCTAMDVRTVPRTLDAHERGAHMLRTTHSLNGTAHRYPRPTAAQAAMACLGDCIEKSFPDGDARVRLARSKTEPKPWRIYSYGRPRPTENRRGMVGC